MVFEYGSTRFVFLLGKRAFKFARISLIRLVLRIFLFPFLGYRWKAPMGQALYSYLFGSIACNRNEYGYYQMTHDPRVMPTRQIFFAGWLVVQDRGVSVSEREMLREYPFDKELLLRSEVDANTAKQFARHPDGRVLLVDYGTLTTCCVLESMSVLRRRFQ